MQSQLLTADEQRCLELTTELWNLFTAMPVYHLSDAPDTARDIHDIQHRVMKRAFNREQQRHG